MSSTGTTLTMTSEGSQQMEIDMSAFMDVVYTYKCKFCTFTCSSSEEMSNHAMSTHVPDHVRIQTIEPAEEPATPQTTQASVTTDTQTTVVEMKQEELKSSGTQVEIATQHEEEYQDGQVLATVITEEEAEDGTVVQGVDTQAAGADSGADLRELFLCGQCRNVGFTTIEECRTHMYEEHNIPMSAAEVKTDQEMEEQSDDVILPANMVSVGTQSIIHKKPGRKRKSEIREETPVEEKDPEEAEFQMDAPIAIFNMRENPDKRRVKAPKSLMEDYYLGVRVHKKRRQPREPYNIKCKVSGCHAKFKTEEAIDIHVSCHLGPKEVAPGKLFKCIKCDSTFMNWKHASKHLWKEHSVDADLHKCYQCEFRADTLQRLETHEQVHSDQKPYTCKTCGKGFKQQSQLTNHEVIHLAKRDDPAAGTEKWFNSKVCGICNKTFASQKSMRKHVEAVHDKLKPYKCQFCGHATARKAMLLLHIRTHTGEKPYKCDLCTYVTGDHNTLRRHRMRHTGQKPYKCQICPYSCIQAISLKTHLKNKHPGAEGIYSCDLCQYHTVSQANWEQHQANHKSGVIPDTPAPPPLKRGKPEAAATTIAVPAQTVNSIATTKSLQSVLSLATTSGTQVLYYDPVTQQLSAGAPGLPQQENTIVMADEATKQLMASSSTVVPKSEIAVLEQGQHESYAVSAGQTEQGVLYTIQSDGQGSETTVVPEGSIIYTQGADQDGQHTIAIEQGQQQVVTRGAESAGLQHILTAIQNMSEEGTVALTDAGGAHAEGTALEIATENVDEAVGQEQYVEIEVPVDSKS